MAIAFRSAGTRLKADVSLTGSPQSVGMPAGHVANDVLLMLVVTDDNTGPDTPSGWSKLFEISPGTSTTSPYAGYPRLNLFYIVDNGSLGSSVSVAFNTGAWPGGDPYVLAFIAAYSGCDTANPIGEWDTSVSTATTAAQAHPSITTALANSWLLTLRAVGADTAKTFTISGGTNTERVDDSHGSAAAPSVALYDAGPLTAGAQTQRTTTADAIVQYGSDMASVVLRPAPVAGGAVALAGVAQVTASANNATVSTKDGPWDLCAPGGLPDYSFVIDWDDDGTVLTTGRVMNPNPYFGADTSDWTAINATIAQSETLGFGMLVLTSSAGASPRAESGQQAVVTGQSYRAAGWLYAPSALPGGTAEVNINWFNSSHSYLSTSNNILTVAPGTWTHFDKTSTAPASAAYASLTAVISGTPGAGVQIYGYGLLLIDPSSAARLVTPGPGENVREDIISDVTVTYGRDQDRQLNPAAVGSASFSVVNADRQYSPEWLTSPLYGDLEPARNLYGSVSYGGTNFDLFRGRVDDYDLKADLSDRTVSFTFLDALNDLQEFPLSTGVSISMRTGSLINTILDEAGWTAGRDLDLGATVVPFWWAEGTSAFQAINDLVKSEGPPSIAYVAPDGTFVFRDRHHRLLRDRSKTSQATFTASALFDCSAPAVTGTYNYTAPFAYSHGWRDIVNSVTFEVSERARSGSYTDVWTSSDTITLGLGQSAEIQISTSDPFTDAITPVSGTDFVLSGGGTLNVVLNRTSGQSAKISLLAVGGAVTVSGLKLRAKSIPVARTVKVVHQDTGSIGTHGERAYPESAPWANANDADAIASMILLHYSQRRPTVQLRVVTQNPTHFAQVLQRTISDRIRIVNGEMGLDDDFFVERVTHTIQRFNQTGHAPVHAVVLGCEKDLVSVTNPFTFNKRGAGFDDGVFDPVKADDAGTVFIFDHPVQGVFDTGLFGT